MITTTNFISIIFFTSILIISTLRCGKVHCDNNYFTSTLSSLPPSFYFFLLCEFNNIIILSTLFFNTFVVSTIPIILNTSTLSSFPLSFSFFLLCESIIYKCNQICHNLPFDHYNMKTIISPPSFNRSPSSSSSLSSSSSSTVFYSTQSHF